MTQIRPIFRGPPSPASSSVPRPEAAPRVVVRPEAPDGAADEAGRLQAFGAFRASDERCLLDGGGLAQVRRFGGDPGGARLLLPEKKELALAGPGPDRGRRQRAEGTAPCPILSGRRVASAGPSATRRGRTPAVVPGLPEAPLVAHRRDRWRLSAVEAPPHFAVGD